MVSAGSDWHQEAATTTGFCQEFSQDRPRNEYVISEGFQETVSRDLDDALSGREESSFEFPLFTRADVRRIDNGVFGSSPASLGDEWVSLVDAADFPILVIDMGASGSDWILNAATTVTLCPW